VAASAAIQGDLVQRISAQGRVFAYKQVDLVAEIQGRLLELPLRDGVMVKKGEMLARLDDREFSYALKEAEARYLAALADYVTFDREAAKPPTEESPANPLLALQAKLERGEISQEDFRQQSFLLELDDIRSGNRRDDIIVARTLEQAKTAVDRARLNLEKCQILAPFDGTLFDVAVAEGQMISGGTKLGRLVNTKDIAIKARILESEVGGIHKGRPASVRFPALADLAEQTGHVEAVSPYVNEADKTVDCIVKLENANERILPGMFAEAIIDSRIFRDVLMVPKTAILPRDNRKVVFKIVEERAMWEYVETGVENDQFIQILSGKIAPGDLVLTDNHFTMGHDTLVEVVGKQTP
jgi:multidrug efflux pump subunit AcrA (membrane-fusion protein)